MSTERRNGTGVPMEAMLADMGVRLRALRKERKLTTERLAETAGVSAGLISQIERGHGNPSFATLVQLAHGLQLPIGQLLQPVETEKLGRPQGRATPSRQPWPGRRRRGLLRAADT